jgi:hypothetical protein
VNSRPPSIEGVVVEIDVSGFQVTFCAASTGLAGADDDTAVAAGFFDSLGVALDDVLTEVGAGFAWLDSAAVTGAAVVAAGAEAAGAAADEGAVALGAVVGTTMRTSIRIVELTFAGSALSEVAAI